MPATLESYIALPSDELNTGKKIKSVSGLIPATSQVELSHYYVPVSIRNIKGLYASVSTLYSVSASAHNATTTGIFWLQVPSSATINVRIRNIEVIMTNAVVTAIDHPTAPRISFSRITHTGSWSGATQSVTKRKTADDGNQADVRTATTSTTVTLGNMFWSAVVPGMDFTTSGVYCTYIQQCWRPTNEDEFIDLAPGEGLVAWQPDAGTASDQRRALLYVMWDEYDNT